jgi:hypothetical protein
LLCGGGLSVFSRRSFATATADAYGAGQGRQRRLVLGVNQDLIRPELDTSDDNATIDRGSNRTLNIRSRKRTRTSWHHGLLFGKGVAEND